MTASRAIPAPPFRFKDQFRERTPNRLGVGPRICGMVHLSHCNICEDLFVHHRFKMHGYDSKTRASGSRNSADWLIQVLLHTDTAGRCSVGRVWLGRRKQAVASATSQAKHCRSYLMAIQTNQIKIFPSMRGVEIGEILEATAGHVSVALPAVLFWRRSVLLLSVLYQ